MNIKKLAASLLAAVMLTGSVGAYADSVNVPFSEISSESGNTFVENGLCYEVLNNGSLKVIAAQGADGLTDIEIPEEVDERKVVGIDANAFYGCEKLNSIIIPKSVTFIGDYAFSNCYKLEEVYYKGIKEDWEKISIGQDNRALTGSLIHFDDGVEMFANSWIFYKDLRYSIKEDGTLAFFNRDLHNVIMYPDGDFGPTINIIDAVIPNEISGMKVTSMGDDVGQLSLWTEDISSLTIPENITFIDQGDWMRSRLDPPSGEYDYVLTEINVDEKNKYYCAENNVLFNKDKTELILYPALPDSEYSIPDSVTRIGTSAFTDNNNLVSITMPDSVAEIGEYAFYCCMNLSSIDLSKNTEKIGKNAFSSCDELSDVYYNGTREEWEKIEIEENNEPLINATIHFLDDPTAADYTDTATGITVTASENTFDEEVTLSVTPLSSDTTKNRFAYDIKFVNASGNEIQPVGEVTVKLPVPETLIGKTVYVFRSTSGKFTDMKAKVEDGYAVFSTDHFSEYILTSENLNSAGGSDSGSDSGSGSGTDTSSKPSTSDTASSEPTSSETPSEPTNSAPGYVESETSTPDASSSAPTAPESNPSTGVAMSILPIVAAISAVVVIKKRK